MHKKERTEGSTLYEGCYPSMKGHDNESCNFTVVIGENKKEDNPASFPQGLSSQRVWTSNELASKHDIKQSLLIKSPANSC